MKTPRFPWISGTLLGVIALACLIIPLATGSARMNLEALSLSPSLTHLFGTDSLGRDVFSMIFHGGRVSLYIGLLATLISTVIAMVYGTAAGLAGELADSLLMRFVELLMSIPSILYVIAIQAILGNPTMTSLAVVIGLTSWMNISKIVRTEVLRVRRTEFVVSAQQMGGGFFYVLRTHLLPNFVPAILFMIVSNVGSAIAAEATLSFMGIGLPTTSVSWGSLMSLSQNALLTGNWWIIVIPGLFLVSTLVCVMNIGEYYRKRNLHTI